MIEQVLNMIGPRRKVLLLIAGLYVMSSAGCAPQHPAASKPAADSNQVAQLERLLADIHKFNGDDIRMYSWLMNSEHLFVGSDDETLRECSIAFVREPGAVDLIFDRLSSPDATPAQVVMCTEILVYYGEYDQPGDESIKCEHVPNEAKLMASAPVAAAMKIYSDAPIKEVVHSSLKKARGE